MKSTSKLNEIADDPEIQNPSRREFFQRIFRKYGKSASFQPPSDVKSSCTMDFSQIPDEALEQICPVMNKHSKYRVMGYSLLYKSAVSGSYKEVHQFDAVQLHIVEHFTGHHTLKDICQSIMETFEMDKAQAFQCVKALFLTLVKQNVCHTKHDFHQDSKATLPQDQSTMEPPTSK